MTSNLPQREAVARIKDSLIQLAHSEFFDQPNRSRLTPDEQQVVLSAAQIISSIQDSWRPPEGWKLVPIRATQPMINKAMRGLRYNTYGQEDDLKHGYAFMVEAAPLPPIPSSLKGSDVGEVGE